MSEGCVQINLLDEDNNILATTKIETILSVRRMLAKLEIRYKDLGWVKAEFKVSR